jgi:hypothetical protein
MRRYFYAGLTILTIGLVLGVVLHVWDGFLDGGNGAIAQEAAPIAPKVPTLVQMQTDAAVIWRGFDLKWTSANHRLNRLGNYIGGVNYSGDSCSANLVYAAASGLAGDIARFTSYYTTIAARGVGFQPGERALVLSGSEGTKISIEAPIGIQADDNLKNRGQYVVILNGFDLCADESADKLKYFKIALSNPTYDPATEKLEFTIFVDLTVDCASIECPAKNDVDYNVKIYYLIIGGEEGSFHKVSKECSRHYSWDKEDEIHLRDVNEEHTLEGEAGYAIGVFALRSLEFELDRDHWMFEWASTVQPLSYSVQTGVGECNLALLFKQWTTGMRVGAEKRPGEATLRARVILLQFENAERRNDSHNGSVEWAGTEGGASSSGCSEDAMATHGIAFDVGI